MKFRKKPLIVEAIKFEKEHIGKAQDFCDKLRYKPVDNEFCIETLVGPVKVEDGEYIVKGPNGEFYPYDVDTFVKTYDIDYVEPNDDNTYYIIECDNGLSWEDHHNYSLDILFKSVDNAKAYVDEQFGLEPGDKLKLKEGPDYITVYAESDEYVDEPEHGSYIIKKVILQD